MTNEVAPPSYEKSMKRDFHQSGIEMNESFGSYEGILSPPTAPPYEPPQQERPTLINLGTLCPDDIRDAVTDYVSEHCCYGKRFVRDADFPNIYNGFSYHYKLETYGEKRQTVDQSTSFFGQIIDGPENGPPPPPWSISVTHPPLFQNGKETKEVPHTAYVKECYRCVGNCRIRCDSCSGRGAIDCTFCSWSSRRDDSECTNCNGTRVESCSSCSGTGQVECPTCFGRGKLKHYKLLIVTWTNHIESFVSETYNLPKELIINVSGREIFKEEHPQLIPINHSEDQAVNSASQTMIQKHMRTYAQEQIKMQRHTVWAVPLTKVAYAWRNRTGEFFVYGFQKKVYFENYPQKCCCCTIL